MLAFGVGFAANGFAVGNFGRLEREIDVVALLELGDDHFDVLLAGTSEKEFFGLRIARKTQCAVFFQNFVNGHANLVFIGAGLRLDGEGDGGLRNPSGRVINRRGFVAERFAGGGFFQLGDGSEVARVQLADFGELLALHHLDVLQALWCVAIVVLKRGIVLEDAAFHLEVVDAPGERIGEGLEHKERNRLAVVVLAFDAIALSAGIFVADLRMLVGMRKRIGQKGEQAGGGDVVRRGSH